SGGRGTLFRCRILCLRLLIPNLAATGARAHLVAFDKNSPDRRPGAGGYANATPGIVTHSITSSARPSSGGGRPFVRCRVCRHHFEPGVLNRRPTGRGTPLRCRSARYVW